MSHTYKIDKTRRKFDNRNKRGDNKNTHDIYNYQRVLGEGGKRIV